MRNRLVKERERRGASTRGQEAAVSKTRESGCFETGMKAAILKGDRSGCTTQRTFNYQVIEGPFLLLENKKRLVIIT